MRRPPLLAVFVALCALLPTTAKAQAAARPLPVPPAHSCRIEIADPLPWLETLLRDPEFRLLCRGGAIGDFAKLIGRAEDPDPLPLLAALRLVRTSVPSSIAIAWPPATGAAVAHLLRFGMLGMLFEANTTIADEEVAAGERADLQPLLLSCLKEIAAARLSARIEFRQPRAAEEFYDGLVAGLEQLANESDGLLRIAHAGDSVRAAMAPGDGIGRDTVAGVLVAMGIVREAEDQAVDAYWRWFAGVSMALTAEVSAGVVRLCLGEGAAAETAAEPLPPPPETPAGTAILQFTYDLRAFAEAALETSAMWQRLSRTQTGLVAVESDFERTIDDIVLLADQVARRDLVSAGRLCATADGLVLATHGTTTHLTDLRDESILRLLPPSVAAWSFDTVGRPADALLALLQGVEGRLYQASMRADDATREAAAEQAIVDWFEKVGELRDILTREATAGWTAPWGAIATPGVKRPIHIGKETVWVSVPGLAAVMTLRTPAAGLPLVRRLFTEAARAIGERLDAATLDRDLGLGVPTVAFAVRNDARAAAADDELVLHAFAVGQHLVLSTSLATSREILAQGKLPPLLRLAGDRAVLAHAATTGNRLGAVIANAGAAGAAFLDTLPPAWNERVVPSDVVALAASAIADLCARFGPIRSIATATDSGTEGLTELLYADAYAARDTTAVLARARAAHGPWPADGRVIAAEGKARYMGGDGSFVFAGTAAGSFVNDIRTGVHERNTCDGTTGTHCIHGERCDLDGAELALLQAATLVWNGGYCAEGAPVRATFAPDTLPFEEPALLLRVGTCDTPFRVQLDPATCLPRRFEFRAESLPTTGPAFVLGDWRDVDGHRMPFEIQVAHHVDGFHVASWQVADDLPPVTSLPAPVAEFGGPPEVEVRNDPRRGLLVRMHGPAGAAWFLLDPRTPTTFATARGAERLGLGAGSSGWVTTALRLGPMTRRGVQFFVGPDADDGSDPDSPVGVVGWPLLRDACVELDVRSPALRLHPPGHWAASPATFTAVRCPASGPNLDVMLAEAKTLPFRLTFEPGPRFRLDVHPLFDDHVLAGQSLQSATGWYRREGLLTTRFAEPRIGEARLPPATCAFPRVRHRAFATEDLPGRIGLDLLAEDCVLLLDLPQSRAAFVPRR